MSCQFAILKLLKPLIEIVRGLPTPPAQAIVEFLKNAEDLVPCMLAATPASVVPLVRGLLCLVIQNLACLRQNLHVVASLLATGPGAVAASEVQSVLDSYQPIVGLLDLASGIFRLAGFAPPQAPQLAVGSDSAALHADQIAIANFIDELQVAADAMGGCPSPLWQPGG
ncbi:MAG TPA: hypothetical protein VMH28_08655 [Candidatus Acidoferrales bacterium]|nr:hypothetical protein [Candidatus Acidoferrales bacterium]